MSAKFAGIAGKNEADFVARMLNWNFVSGDGRAPGGSSRIDGQLAADERADRLLYSPQSDEFVSSGLSLRSREKAEPA